MKLFQNVLQLLRNGQAQMTSIFQKGNPFVGQVEEDHRRAQNAALSQYIANFAKKLH